MVNYLSDGRRLRVGLVGAEPYPFVEMTAAEAETGYLAGGDSARVRLAFRIAAEAPANQSVILYTRIRDGTFEDGADLLSFRVNQSIEPVHRSLSAFYTATGGDNWARNDNWDITRVPSEDELATWFGIGLGEEGWLVEWFLRENNLVGVPPPQLGSLPQLERLNLRFNSLKGPIPPELVLARKIRED